MMDRRLYQVCEQTWRPRTATPLGPFVLRDGDGGGKRVSAATCSGTYDDADLARVEAAMQALGQSPLFMIQTDNDALDRDLAARGYRVVDPVNLLIGNCVDIARHKASGDIAYEVWPPLATQCDIWKTDNIGPERLRVMDRVTGPKTSIMIRHKERAAGTCFIAEHDGVAMLHGLVVENWARRQGLAHQIMGSAAQWAQNIGIELLSVLVVKSNAPANALYASLNMENVGSYHYRMK